MMNVRFNRAMRPYGAGDTALLPDDVAERVVAEGAAQREDLPKAPHAAGLNDRPAPAPAPEPPKTRKPKLPFYRTKEA